MAKRMVYGLKKLLARDGGVDERAARGVSRRHLRSAPENPLHSLSDSSRQGLSQGDGPAPGPSTTLPVAIRPAVAVGAASLGAGGQPRRNGARQGDLPRRGRASPQSHALAWSHR